MTFRILKFNYISAQLPKRAVVLAYSNFIEHFMITPFPKLETPEMTLIPLYPSLF